MGHEGDEDLREGTVIRSAGKWYEVHTSEGTVRSRVRGKFRLEDRNATNPIAVGDEVSLRMNEDGTGLITDIHPRRNKLSRRSAGPRPDEEHVLVANVDRAWEVQAVAEPGIDPAHVDRFLIMAQVHEIPAGLIVNKIDLLRDAESDPHADARALRAELDRWTAIYRELGHPVLHTSAETGEGLETLREALRGGTNVFTGPSGVGKSTLLNRLEPDLDLRTGAVSPGSQRGRHTTTHAGLYPLSSGSSEEAASTEAAASRGDENDADPGFVVDTPGVEGFGLVDVAPEELDWFFPEMRAYVPDCHFPDCTHDHEPRCAVQEAVADGAIFRERYESYLEILHQLQEEREQREHPR
jgi:ribosome biogenesis GTPase